ncbi:MAG: hypothetical protein J6S89_00315 [Paludibacteraceae bacterium]|nr:hypothetical protein [Paludibacteraceae bacterium]
MKKIIIPVILILIAAIVVGFFSLYHEEEIVQEERYSVVQVGEMRVMDIPKSKIDFSPIVSAILYTHLRDHDLTLSFPVTIQSTREFFPTDSLYCGFEYKDKKIYNRLDLNNLTEQVENGPLKVGEFSKRKNVYMYCLQLDFDLSSLLSDMDEMDVLSYVASIPSPMKEKEFFLGKGTDAFNSFIQGTWKNVPMNIGTK